MRASRPTVVLKVPVYLVSPLRRARALYHSEDDVAPRTKHINLRKARGSYSAALEGQIVTLKVGYSSASVGLVDYSQVDELVVRCTSVTGSRGVAPLGVNYFANVSS
jgi:hypothetical protein